MKYLSHLFQDLYTKTKKFLIKIFTRKEHRVVNILFNISIIIKFIDGVIELVGGLLFSILREEKLLHIVRNFFQNELYEIPHKTVVKYLAQMSNLLESNTKIFISIILISNGFIKIVMSIALLRRMVRTFPYIIGFLIVLFVYQCVELLYTPSLYLMAFNLFDLFVIFLICREYKNLKTMNS